MSEPVRFYLGSHQPGWLARAGVPLFISKERRVSTPPAPHPRTTKAAAGGHNAHQAPELLPPGIQAGANRPRRVAA